MKTELSQTAIWGIVVGMAVLNYAVRFPPIAIVSRLELPAPLLRWLSFVPISVMGALVAGEVLRPVGTATASPLTSPSVYAALITGVVFRFTKSFLGATVAGMASFVALTHLMSVL